MRLAEMKKFPTTAGKARLEFSEAGTTPLRNNENISLPLNRECEYFSLRDGKQFLYVLYRYGKQVYFGGTDENPFLVQLQDRTLSAFLHDGEKGFYHSLKPSIIDLFETKLKKKTKRQGDFFAFPLPWSWERLAKSHLINTGLTMPVQQETNLALNSTRHLFQGTMSQNLVPLLGYRARIFEGTINAPDHEPLVLKGPHAIEQAANLAQPQSAD